MSLADQLDGALVERSYGPADVPGKFWFSFYLHRPEYVKQIASGTLKGFKGISSGKRIVLQWFGMARNGLFVMPGKEVVAANKLTRILYGNPEYLVSRDFEALYRIFDKVRGKSYGPSGMMTEFSNYVMRALKTTSGSKDTAGVFHYMQHGEFAPHRIGDYYSKAKPRIRSIKDVGKFFHRATLWLAKNGDHPGEHLTAEASKVTEQAWSKIVRDAALLIGKIYSDESEWLVKGDTFKIPKPSRLIILVNPIAEKRHIDTYLSGGTKALMALLTKEGVYDAERITRVHPGTGERIIKPTAPAAKPNKHGFYKHAFGGPSDPFSQDGDKWEDVADVLEPIRANGLHHKYETRFVDQSKFNATKKKLISQW